MSKPVVYLFKSDKPNKKWAAFYPTTSLGANGASPSKKVIHFGGAGYRDFTLISNKQSKHYIADTDERNKVKTAYQARHKNDNLAEPQSSGALSWYILWTAPTLKGGMKQYAKTFSYKVVDKTTTKYSQEEAKKLI